MAQHSHHIVRLLGMPTPSGNANKALTLNGTEDGVEWTSLVAGTLTSFAFTDGNGFDGTVTNATTTPTLSLTSTVADTRVMYSTSGALTGSGQLTFTGQALQLSSTNTTQTTTGSVFAITPSVLTTGTGLYVTSSTLTTGKLIDVILTGTAANGYTGVNVGLTGANASSTMSSTGLTVTNHHTGTNPINYGIVSSISSNFIGTAIQGSATGASNVIAIAGSSDAGYGGNFSSDTGVGIYSGTNTNIAAWFNVGPSSTNTVVDVLRLGRSTSGGAGANGLGAAITFNLKTSTTDGIYANSIASRWTNATHASLTSEVLVSGMSAGNTVQLLSISGAGLTTFGVSGTNKGSVALAGNTSGLVTIQPAAAAGTWTLTLPTDDGNNGEVLITDGSGNTSWSSAPSALPTFASGNYTPTATIVDGLVALTVIGFQYMRVGSVVTVSGALTATAGTDPDEIEFTLTLPVGSTFSNAADCSGTVGSTKDCTLTGIVYSVNTQTVARVKGSTIQLGPGQISVHFTYIIK